MATQIMNISYYNAGYLMKNKKTEAFYFLGRMWAPSGLARKHKYSFDDSRWTHHNMSLHSKWVKVLSFKYKPLIDCKKSKEAGVL